MYTISDEKHLEVVANDSSAVNTKKSSMRQAKTAQLRANIKELKAKRLAKEKRNRSELRDLEQDVLKKEREQLELDSELLEINERLLVVRSEMQELSEEIERANSDRRVMRKDLYALRNRNMGTINNARNFFVSMTITNSDDQESEPSRHVRDTTTESRISSSKRVKKRRMKTNELCEKLAHDVHSALRCVQDFEFGRYMSFRQFHHTK